MGAVTSTQKIGEIMQSHTFESYDDFVKWTMIQDDLVPSPYSGEAKCSEEVCYGDDKYTLTLDEHEVYTLRLLLDHCFDEECASINAKLDQMCDDDLDCEDYNRMYFQYINENGDVEELHDGEKDVSIRFK